VGFGDEFDDFEEGAQAGEDDDFGDFGDDFEEVAEDEETIEESRAHEISETPFTLNHFHHFPKSWKLPRSTWTQCSQIREPRSSNPSLSRSP
jgi:hypothetical protein